MITEDYVSFETAKLLKEKGFDVYGDGSLDSGIEIYKEYSPNGSLNSCAMSKPHFKAYPAPTLQMAMKWLREVHKIACQICPSIENGFHTNKWHSYIHKLSDNFPKDPLWFVETTDSYEEAAEAAIKYCLTNLI